MPIIGIQDMNNLSSIINGDKLVVLEFTAKWCGPCKKIGPQVERLSNMYKYAQFYKVEVDKPENISKNYNIRAVPTFILFKGGNIIGKYSGINLEPMVKVIQTFK